MAAQLSPQLIAVHRLSESGLTNSNRGTGLKLAWDDGQTALLSSEVLRRNCPCASCLEAKGAIRHNSPLSPTPTSRRTSLLRVIDADMATETDLQEIWALGNYAIGIRWGDRHDTGIYSYSYLRQLSFPASNDSSLRE